MVGVEHRAELRCEHSAAGESIKRLVRETELSKNAIRRALRSETPPRYHRPSGPGVLETFKPEIHRLLGEDPQAAGVRIRELLAPLGCTAGKTVVDDYLREVRLLFARPTRAFQRTVYFPERDRDAAGRRRAARSGVRSAPLFDLHVDQQRDDRADNRADPT